MTSERRFLESELAEITRILDNIPEEDALDRATFQCRQKEVEKQLRKLKDKPEQETMVITFRGEPVRERHGISADFSSKILNTLSEAFASLVAVVKGTPPSSSGIIPEKDKHRLFVTGTALGSFGFELELPKEEKAQVQQHSLLPEAANPLLSARDMLEDLLSRALEDDDEKLADSVESAGTRALDKIREFYETLKTNNATFSLKTGAARFIDYPNMERVCQAADRLKSDNIVEYEKVFTGKFTGVLPMNRDFEFCTDENKPLRGKIGVSFENAKDLFADWTGKKVTIKLNVRTVGKGRPRYTLLDRSCITASA